MVESKELYENHKLRYLIKYLIDNKIEIDFGCGCCSDFAISVDGKKISGRTFNKLKRHIYNKEYSK